MIEAIRKCLAEANIENAVILSGVATFDRLQYHYVHDSSVPPKEHHANAVGAFEVANISGLILHGEPHIHFTAHDINQGMSIAAHLEPDTRVLYVAELVICEIASMDPFERVSYPDKVIL